MDNPATGSRHLTIDARQIVLLRDTKCERALAMVSANADIGSLLRAISETGIGTDLHPGPGSGARRFGRSFENGLLAKDAKALREPLTRLFGCDFSDAQVEAESRGREGVVYTGYELDAADSAIAATPGEGNDNVWRRTAQRIVRRWTEHDRASILIHPVLRIPGLDQLWFLIPDILVSPAGCPYYYPFEIKAYERMGHLTDDGQITSAAIQSALYLYCLVNGIDGEGEPLPEAASEHNRRTDFRSGLVFRRNGTRIPEPMLVSAERDLIAIGSILADVHDNAQGFAPRFGQSYKAVHSGDLVAIEHIRATFSDACHGRCPLAQRCRERVRMEGRLSAYGDSLARVYAPYETLGQLLAATESEECIEPDARRARAIDAELETLLARAGAA